jgi:hypothetical protein
MELKRNRGNNKTVTLFNLEVQSSERNGMEAEYTSTIKKFEINLEILANLFE